MTEHEGDRNPPPKEHSCPVFACNNYEWLCVCNSEQISVHPCLLGSKFHKGG